MGIKGLYKIIIENTDDCIIKKNIKNYSGKIIAIDTSLLLYQFIIAIRKNGYDLLNNKGKSVSHLYAIFVKTIHFLENGIKPVYVFDGKPPELKKNILKNRKKTRKYSKYKLMNERLTREDRIKYFKRTVQIEKEQYNECKKLLRILKVPYIESPGEADAQCAVLARAGKVWGVCTEDMDILTFGSPIILKNFSASRNKQIIELNLEKIKSSLGITQEQFIDLCILLGCDYCGTLTGLNKKNALQIIKENGGLEQLVNKIKQGEMNYKLPSNYPYKEIKKYFKNPNVLNPDEINLRWGKIDKKEVIKYMCKNNGFKYYKISNRLARLPIYS